MKEQNKTNVKLWNKNFILLWQGQFVSAFGDALYSIALNFFVLQETGSTAIMGTVMALVTIPEILLGPIAGVVVDRMDRKTLIIWGDIIRGASILLIGILAKQGYLQVWMVFVVAIILGIVSSFFSPAIESVLPDMVHKEKLVKANSLYQSATMGAGILGQSIGGVLYPLLGAPLMFILDGISYLFSSVTECFLHVPKVMREKRTVTWKDDIKQGMRFILGSKGLLRTIEMSFFINFFFGMIRVSLVPWFVNSDHLGMEKYGVLSAVISLGVIIGMLLLSVVDIKQKQNYRIYISSLFAFIFCIAFGAITNTYFIILLSFGLAFTFQFVFNTILNAVTMKKTPIHQRGKVFATKITLVMAISPVGNFLGGVLCEYINPRTLIIVNCGLAIIMVLLTVIHPTVKQFLVENEEKV